MCVGALLSPAGAEDAPARIDFKTYRPSAVATRIDSAQAPVIDGDLSDAVWASVPTIENFYQLEPEEGRPVSERTVARVAYDENNIYIAFYNYDREPEKILASAKARDGDTDKDDFIRIYLDPGMTRRDGYAFVVNANGARLDAVIENNTNYLVEWDTIWAAQSRLVADGWVTEVSIPFRSISYDASRSDWGFDLFRLIRRKNERSRWTSIDRAIQSVDISRSGTLTGVTGIAQGLGLEVQSYAVARLKHEWGVPRETDLTIEPSGNAYYRITPALTGSVTFNTDFSDTPLDQRRVNTSRFSLFFPETRDFFLQDVAVFEFGGGGFFEADNGRPFFSRNIGLVNGAPVDIVAGGKLSGQLGGLGIGALAVQTEGTAVSDGQLLSAARVTMPILDESEVGLVFTSGDPTGDTKNSVGGIDFQYNSSTLFEGKTFKADFFYERSFTDPIGDDDAFGFQVGFPNEPWSGRFRFKEIGEDFYPALGFINRTGIRDYSGFIANRTRFENSAVRWVEFSTFYSFVTDLDNRLESRENGVSAGTYLQSGDLAFIDIFNDYENVTTPFELPRGVMVPAKEYEWTNISPYFETSQSRSVQASLDLECCSFLDGDMYSASLSVNYRPDSTFAIAPNYFYQRIDLPTGDLEIQIYALDFTVNFTPDMQLLTQVQYDNISQGVGLSARYRWEFAPGSELFVAVGESADLREHLHYSSQTSQASIRIGHTLRF